ncbi:MAG TPA: right-handed parallel beta-helix repeat-containing protein [Bryobacteraceae bacterium]|nr:right-handed parallel beta-helix repeat-containing protein [Bryobacteraceae bacterium]
MRFLTTAALFSLFLLSACRKNPADAVQRAIRSGAAVELPAGEIHLSRPLTIPKGTKDLAIQGNPKGSTIVLDPGFAGRAAIEGESVSNVSFRYFSITGDRAGMKSAWALPRDGVAFADFYSANGIVIRGGSNIGVRGVSFSKIRAFPLLLNAVHGAAVDAVTIADCGTLNPDGHNNTTGGILLEEGVKDFEITGSKISRIPGNAIWTHSYANSPRQERGRIANNDITMVARDAIQIGHANRIRVENNRGSQIGFPVEYVDFPGYATPVALDTSGNVDYTVYTGNTFTSVAGQCVDLDGFHDGMVSGNKCVNNPAEARNWLGLHFGILFGNHDPGMSSVNISVTGNTLEGFAYGGVFLIGERHRIEDNRFLDVNLAHCGSSPAPAKCAALPDQPDALRSGIYLATDGGRPAVTRGNIIRNNTVRGFGIAKHCIAAAKGVDLRANTIAGNTCQSAP